jgi:hypothetical protein
MVLHGSGVVGLDGISPENLGILVVLVVINI